MIVRKENEIILKEFYELFYWKEPDFEIEEIDEQFQCMMRILEHYQIYLSKFGFSINATIKHTPYNHDIQDYIDKLRAHPKDEECKLNKFAIMKIQMISIALHKKAEEEGLDYYDLVKSVSAIIHVNEQVLPNKNGKEFTKISYIDNTEEEIESILSLVKKVDEDIENHKEEVK